MENIQTQGTSPENFTERKIGSQRTIKRILWNKFLDLLENSTFRQIFSTVLLVIVSAILTFILTYTKETVSALNYAAQFNNWIIPKAIGSFIVVFNFKKILELSKSFIPEFPESPEEPTGDTIEGIPVIEMLDHLFEFESFKRADIEKKFGIPRNRFTDLANKLEELGVLKRGENNSRILNSEFARIDVAAILQGKSSADDLRQLHRQENENTWTTRPSKMSIIEKVKNALTQKKEEDESPSPQFTRRKLGFVEE